MKNIIFMKNVLATIAGLVVAMITVFLFETLLGHNLFPLPENVDPNDMESIKTNMHLIPMGAKVFVVIGHFAGIFVGMLVAGAISKTSMIPSYIVAAFMIAATAFVTIMLPKSMWFIIAEVVAVIAGFFFGKSFASRYVFGKLV